MVSQFLVSTPGTRKALKGVVERFRTLARFILVDLSEPNVQNCHPATSPCSLNTAKTNMY